MIEEITVFGHNAIKIIGDKIVYIDPYNLEEENHDADFIFCTHTHYDHYSPKDIEKIRNENTIIIGPKDMPEGIKVLPNVKYEIEGLKFQTTYAYNMQKPFHPKQNEWVGYILELNNKKYYIAGDTDNIPEIRDIECDVAFIPIGGCYTMDKKEAVELCKTLKAKIIVPTHYGMIIGDKKDGEEFAKMLKNKNVQVLIKNIL